MIDSKFQNIPYQKNMFNESNAIDSFIDEDAKKKIYDFEKGEGWLQDVTICHKTKEPFKNNDMYENNEINYKAF
jgi:hypothetical protein